MATVTEVSGRAWVRQPDGSLQPLHPGRTVALDSDIITDARSTVTLAIDGAAAITIGESRSVAITGDLFTPTDPADAAVAAPASPDSERLLAALESGEDPFGILEATAAIAGGPGGDDGGSSFVRLVRILEGTTSMDLAYPRSGRVQEELPRLNGTAGVNAVITTPPNVTPPNATLSITDFNTGTKISRVWESALAQGSGSGSATTSGQMVVTASDGISTITLGGQPYALGALAGQAIAVAQGTLTITNVTPNGDATSATIAYTYTITNAATHDKNTNDDEVHYDIAIAVLGNSGSLAADTLTLTIVDDMPQANGDTNANGAVTQANENAVVEINARANDKEGADGVDWVNGVKVVNNEVLLNGVATDIGKLVYHNDGTFTYTPAPGEEGTVTFQYTITDGDGDTSTATVTITLAGDSEPDASIKDENGNDVAAGAAAGVVWESALSNGSGGGTATTNGTFAVDWGGDERGSLQLKDAAGTLLDTLDLTVAGSKTVSGQYGTLTVTVNAAGDMSWTYLLTGNAPHTGANQTGNADQLPEEFKLTFVGRRDSYRKFFPIKTGNYK